MISGNGPSAAHVMIISDGGDDNDIAKGYAITGQQERLYSEFAHANGLDFRDFYRTSLIKDRINLKKWKENVTLVTEQYKEILTAEIRAISPNVIVPVGELAFQFVSGGVTGIRKFRGSVLPLKFGVVDQPVRVIPVLGVHPFLNDEYELRFISRIDFAKVAKNINTQGPIEEIGVVWVARTASALRAFLDRQYLTATRLHFDIETFADVPTCISFCFDGKESVCVPITDRSMPIDDRALMLHLVARVLASDIPKVNQNIKFDWRKLERLGFLVKNVVGDTMLAASVLYCEFPKNLGFLTSLYTDMPYFKDEGKEYDPSLPSKEKLYLYNAKDSLSDHQIYTAQLVEMKEQGVLPVYETLIQIMPIYKQMEENGILIDDTIRQNLLGKYLSLLGIQIAKLHKLAGKEVNPNSPKQMTELVFQELEYDRSTRGVGGTDEESLELLYYLHSEKKSFETKEILKSIIACRKIKKVLEILDTPIHLDMRMRCEFNLAGANTGRTTAGKTTDTHIVFDGKLVKLVNLGRSFQTIGKHGFTIDEVEYGKEIRSMFVSTPGYNFVEIDLSQAEARVDAVLAKDYDILSVFDGPIGIHRLTGSWLFDCKPEEIKKGTRQYHESKTARHAGERNMMETRLMLMIHQPMSKCRDILNKFHKNQPNIREVFHREIREQVKNFRLLVAPNGRRRDFFGRYDNDQINEAISTLPQMIVTDQMKQALRPTFDKVSTFARPISEAHDGFLSEVREGREQEYTRIFKENLEVPIDFSTCSLSRNFKLTIPSEAAFGKNWLEKEMRPLL